VKQKRGVPLPLTALAELLVERGVLTEEERDRVKDWATLTAVAESKAKDMATRGETRYLTEVDRILAEGRWIRKRLSALEPPESLQRYHRLLLTVVPTLVERKEKRA
jgi:hypothetical protein